MNGFILGGNVSNFQENEFHWAKTRVKLQLLSLKVSPHIKTKRLFHVRTESKMSSLHTLPVSELESLRLTIFVTFHNRQSESQANFTQRLFKHLFRNLCNVIAATSMQRNSITHLLQYSNEGAEQQRLGEQVR